MQTNLYHPFAWMAIIAIVGLVGCSDSGSSKSTTSAPTSSSNPAPVTVMVTASSDLDPSLRASNLVTGQSGAPPWHSQKPVNLPEWLLFEYPNPVAMKSLRLQSQPTDGTGNPQLGRAPKDFFIQGSNDKENWTNLLEVAGSQFNDAWEWKEWEFDNNIPYKYYRIYITANNGDPTLITIYRAEFSQNFL